MPPPLNVHVLIPGNCECCLMWKKRTTGVIKNLELGDSQKSVWEESKERFYFRKTWQEALWPQRRRAEWCGPVTTEAESRVMKLKPSGSKDCQRPPREGQDRFPSRASRRSLAWQHPDFGILLSWTISGWISLRNLVYGIFFTAVPRKLT